MPTPLAHALVPLAGALALGPKRIPVKLVIVAALAAAAPDLDGLIDDALNLGPWSIYAHRGAGHSLGLALLSGLIAALFHQRLGVQRLTGGVVIAASMASHGLLDMMTDLGAPIAYLWPLSSTRLFAEWRPLHSGPVEMAHLFAEGIVRLHWELEQIIVPIFCAALAVRAARTVLRKTNGARQKVEVR